VISLSRHIVTSDDKARQKTIIVKVMNK
jgi:hypothetical protein